MYDAPKPNPIDPRAFRDCCGRFATGVTVVTTRTREGDHGATVSAFMSVSLDPALIAVSLGKQSKLREKIQTAGRFAVNILGHDMQQHALHFAGRSDPTLENLFEEECELPVLRGASAVLIADVDNAWDAGDHTIFLGGVTHLKTHPATQPLLYHAGTFGSLCC